MRKSLKICIGCAGTFAILTVVALVVGAWFISSQFSQHGAEEDLERELALIRQRGEPVTPEELEDFCRPDPSETDVAPLFAEATSLLAKPEFKSDAEGIVFVGLKAPEPAWPGEEWREKGAAKDLLAKYGSQLEQLHAAAELDGMAYHRIDFHRGIAASLEHLEGWRAAARLLCLEALVAAHEDRPHDAARAICAVYAMTNSLQREPVLVSQTTRVGLQWIAHLRMEKLLPRVAFASEDLRALQEELRKSDFHASLKQALLGERVLILVVFSDPGAFVEGSQRTPIPDAPIQRSVDAMLFLQFMEGMIAAVDEPWPEVRRHFREADQQVRIRASGFPGNLRYTLTALFLPSFDSSVVVFARAEAARLVLDAAIAAELFRRDNGDFAENLQQLVPAYLPALPVDPFDWQPLRYRKTGEATTIYSIGEDECDDGGKGDLAGKPDLQFTWPR